MKRTMIIGTLATMALTSMASAQDVDSARHDGGLGIVVRSAMLEGYVYPVVVAWGVSADVDVARTKGGAFAAGARARFADISTQGMMSDYYSAFHLVGILLRATYGSSSIRLDLYGGPVWLGVTEAGFEFPEEYSTYWRASIGADVRWMFVEHHVGLLLRVATVIDPPPGVSQRPFHDAGIGIVVGWEP